MGEKKKGKGPDGASGSKEYHREVGNVIVGVIGHLEKAFAKVHIDGPAVDPAKIQKSPMMIVSTHRSHVDYFLVGSYLSRMGFRNLRFAAGDNLTKLPWIGKRFLAFGAFSVSRDSGFERNYVRNLCGAVVKMLRDGDAVLVFPEGGRSYSGAMLEIRGGILNAALITQAANPDIDVYLLPTTVSYEYPPDLPQFPLLLKGKKMRKKPTNFLKKTFGSVYYFGADIMAFAPFMLAKRFGRGKYGEAYMDYGQPISVKSLVDLEANRVEGARDEFAAHRASLDILGQKLNGIFTSMYRVLPVHIVATILCGQEYGAGIGGPGILALELYARTARQALKEAGRNCKALDGLTDRQIAEKGIKQLRRLKAVSVERTDERKVRVLKPQIIDYFAATTARQEGKE